MREADITGPLLVAASQRGWRLFRQNTGMGWAGKVISRTRDQMIMLHPQPLRAGLCVGSSDVIGWIPVVVTPEMVGQTVAVFAAAEVKTPGVTMTKEQIAFGMAVLAAGGRFAEVRDVEKGMRTLADGGLL